MPTQDLLILAVTKMLGGVCIAGMTGEPDPVTGLCWVRPIREFGHVLLGDITTPGQAGPAAVRRGEFQPDPPSPNATPH